MSGVENPQQVAEFISYRSQIKNFMQKEKKLAGRTALITGASKGLGKAMALSSSRKPGHRSPWFHEIRPN